MNRLNQKPLKQYPASLYNSAATDDHFKTLCYWHSLYKKPEPVALVTPVQTEYLPLIKLDVDHGQAS